MRLAIVNPNRIAACTALLQKAAGSAVGTAVDVDALQPERGPVELHGEIEAALSAVGVLEVLSRTKGDYDGFVLAGFGEPGLEAARELTGKPVVDITEAGPLAALSLGRRYLVVTSTAGAIPTVEDRLRALGLDGRCAGVTAVGSGVPGLVADPEGSAARAAEAALEMARPGDVVVLGCGGMAGLAPAVARLARLPVIDPTIAAMVALHHHVAFADHPNHPTRTDIPEAPWLS